MQYFPISLSSFATHPIVCKVAGFTLIETMVVTAIIAILAAMAAPSFLGLIAGTNVSSAVNSFISDSRYARGEAMRRGKSVSVCRTSTPADAAPVCSGGDGLAVGGWAEGWIVFEDLDHDGIRDAGDTILRSQEPLSRIGNFFAVAANTVSAVSTGNSIRFDATGRAVGQQGRWLVRASGDFANDVRYTRTLCMNSVGRVRLTQGEVVC